METTFANIKVNENVNTRKYRLMYFFGAWVTKEVIYAENDAEAIFDADEVYKTSNMNNWKYAVVLWCGNRRVKYYDNRAY